MGVRAHRAWVQPLGRLNGHRRARFGPSRFRTAFRRREESGAGRGDGAGVRAECMRPSYLRRTLLHLSPFLLQLPLLLQPPPLLHTPPLLLQPTLLLLPLRRSGRLRLRHRLRLPRLLLLLLLPARTGGGRQRGLSDWGRCGCPPGLSLLLLLLAALDLLRVGGRPRYAPTLALTQPLTPCPTTPSDP